MARYRCNVCGYIYDEEKEQAPFSSLNECPVCHQPATAFALFEEVKNTEAPPAAEKKLDCELPLYGGDSSDGGQREIRIRRNGYETADARVG